MTLTPVSLSQALASFGDIYSPRIVGRVNDYDVKIAHAQASTSGTRTSTPTSFSW